MALSQLSFSQNFIQESLLFGKINSNNQYDFKHLGKYIFIKNENIYFILANYRAESEPDRKDK